MLIFIYFSIAVGVSFLCSILEAVLLSITSSHVEMVKNDNKKLGKLMEKQRDNMDYSIAAILTLNTFAHTLGAAGVGSEAAKVFGEEYMFYISAILTILILVFSEIIPKTLGAYYWKNLAGVSTRIIKVLVFITYPMLVILNKITNFITPKEKESITKEEIIATANIAEEKGVLKEKEINVIQNLLFLNKVKVKDILTPRKVMFSVSKEEFLGSFSNKKLINLEKFKEYSRVPVFENNIDDVIGMIISKEYFHELVENSLDNKTEIIKPIIKVNENIPVSKLIDLFITKQQHMFLVVDNYGQTEGIVSFEDTLESLLGVDIVDELDSNTNMRELAKKRVQASRNKKI